MTTRLSWTILVQLKRFLISKLKMVWFPKLTDFLPLFVYNSPFFPPQRRPPPRVMFSTIHFPREMPTFRYGTGSYLVWTDTQNFWSPQSSSCWGVWFCSHFLAEIFHLPGLKKYSIYLFDIPFNFLCFMILFIFQYVFSRPVSKSGFNRDVKI